MGCQDACLCRIAPGEDAQRSIEWTVRRRGCQCPFLTEPAVLPMQRAPALSGSCYPPVLVWRTGVHQPRLFGQPQAGADRWEPPRRQAPTACL